MDSSIITGLFEQGVRNNSPSTPLLDFSHLLEQLMGIETSADHGGAESSFTSAIIAIEELAKIDPSVSVMCDVHNTLVNTIFRKYGTKEQQDKWLPQLAESKVHPHCIFPFFDPCLSRRTLSSLEVSACLSLRQVLTHSRFKLARRKTATIGSSMVPRCGSQTLMKPKSFSFSPMYVSAFVA